MRIIRFLLFFYSKKRNDLQESVKVYKAPDGELQSGRVIVHG